MHDDIYAQACKSMLSSLGHAMIQCISGMWKAPVKAQISPILSNLENSIKCAFHIPVLFKEHRSGSSTTQISPLSTTKKYN